MGAGRPSNYTFEIAKEICEQTAVTTLGLGKICEQNPHWPCEKVIYDWLRKNKEFSDLYAQAKRDQIEIYIKEIVELSDNTENDLIQTEGRIVVNNGAINRARLQIDTRKWLACKLVPRVYGEKITQEIKSDLSSMDAKEISQAIRGLSIDMKKAVIHAILEDMQQEIKSGE